MAPKRDVAFNAPRKAAKQSKKRPAQAVHAGQSSSQSPFDTEGYIPYMVQPDHPNQQFSGSQAYRMQPEYSSQHFSGSQGHTMLPEYSTQQFPGNQSGYVETHSSSTEEDEFATVGGKEKKWSPDDEVLLAKSWCHLTENKKGKKRTNFWMDVHKHYVKLGGDPSRSFSSLNGKWRYLNTELNLYNGLYIQQTRMQASGLGPDDYAKRAKADYYKIKKRPFTHELAYDVVKDFPKWEQVPLAGQSVMIGRSFPINETYAETVPNADDIDMEIPDLNTDNAPSYSRRGKKSRSSSDSLGDINKTLAEYTISKKEILEGLVQRRKEKDELIIAGLKKKNEEKDLKTYMRDHENITNPALLQQVLSIKSRIAEEHGWVKYWE